MQPFLERQIKVQTFCTKFTKLWMQERDNSYAKKVDWPEPYNELIIASFQRGEISGSEFRQAYSDLWSNAEDQEFEETINAIYSACDCWYPLPEREGEIDENQLRREVADAFAALREPKKSLVQAI
ncbi:MAG: colicin immunity domain-containing protein [Janthinobacterium lividum]